MIIEKDLGVCEMGVNKFNDRGFEVLTLNH